MKIIQQGTLPERPEDTTHKATCETCKSEIEYNISDVSTEHRATISCPFCHSDIYLGRLIADEVIYYHENLNKFYYTHPVIAERERK